MTTETTTALAEAFRLIYLTGVREGAIGATIVLLVALIACIIYRNRK
jgi:hypothetical protein